MNDKIYIGSATNMERGMSEHMRDHTATTRKLDDLRIVWRQELSTIKEARMIEKK